MVPSSASFASVRAESLSASSGSVFVTSTS
jgi:hypothetical protein